MNNTVKNVLIFSLGAATGSLVAWRLLKTKYEQFAQNEIDSYKEYVRAKKPIGEDEKQATDEKVEEPVKKKESIVPEYLLNRYRSDDYEKEDGKYVREPYVISPDEYGTCDGYECTSLTYYADGVLTDEWDNVIEDPDSMVGEDFASHFGEYEDDSVFVRNEGEKRDYEILRDLNSFEDTIGADTHPESEE